MAWLSSMFDVPKALVWPPKEDGLLRPSMSEVRGENRVRHSLYSDSWGLGGRCSNRQLSPNLQVPAREQ